MSNPIRANVRQALALLRSIVQRNDGHPMPGDLMYRAASDACGGNKAATDHIRIAITNAIGLVRASDRPMGFTQLTDFAQNASREHAVQVLDHLDAHFAD